MFSVDFRDFERMAERLGGMPDQVRFATANAMTTAAFRTREKLILDTWPGAVTVRNKNFLRSALRVERATKRNLTVAITTEGTSAGGRGHLMLHAKGGAKRAVKRLAIPPSSGPGAVRRTARGVSAAQTPRAIVAAIPKRALRITPKGIFEGKGGRLMLRYTFKAGAQIKKDVPFIADFRRLMVEEIQRAFPASIARAMKSRR